MKAYRIIHFLAFEQTPSHRIIDEKRYETGSDLKTIVSSYDEVIVATGNNALREKKCQLLIEMKKTLATILHPSAVISPFAKIDVGSIVLANAVINANACIAKGCIINTSSVIEHDCIIGEYVNICPKVAIAGHVHIGRSTFLGIGCSVINGIMIGSDVIIGAGAVVVKNIPNHVTATGVPAKIKI